MSKVGIIGAGPAGLTAAHELVRLGHEVEVFEASGEVGGMTRSFSLWGAQVDLGPHRFFSRDPRVCRLWHGLVGEDYREVDRMTRIFYRNRLFDYPLRPTNVLRQIGAGESLRCLASYLRQLPARGGPKPDSFEEWTVRAFGRRLFDLFFKGYSEKLWGIPCSEIDSAFAAQRIRRFSLGQALRQALPGGRGRHRTLVDRFPHPTQGAGLVYRRMADRITAGGGNLHLHQRVAGLSGDGGGLRLAGGEEVACDRIVSTMPLTVLCRALPELPEEVAEALGHLQFRHTVLVYLRIDQRDLFPDQWLYVQSPELRLGRVTNFANWPNGAGRDDTILALEYWCDNPSHEWSRSDEEWRSVACREITATGLLGTARIVDHHVIRVPRCYPIYRRGYRAWLEPVMHFLRERHPAILPIGRYGSFKYNNQDHSILMGMLAAENIDRQAGHDLWEVNTDYDVYQEEGESPRA
jgi:protoporphyrinogen oxidase